MTKVSKSHLLATSAVAGLAILQLTPAAQAQESFGIHNDQPEMLVVTVGAGETVEGADIGVYADNGPVEVVNDGTIRGNGTNLGSADSRPSGGVVVARADSTVNNSGEITGAASGVTTSYFFGEDENDDSLPPQALAENTAVANEGLIRGSAGTGVGLGGGGTVVNSGTIQGFNGDAQQAQGIGVALTEFPDAIREGVTGIGSVDNAESGLIEGEMFGVIVAGGGTIDNAGTIRSTGLPNPSTPGVSPFGVIMTAGPEQVGRETTLNNSGTVEGLLGILAAGSLESSTINNSGVIRGQATAVFAGLAGDLVISNEEGGEITSNGFVAINSTNGTLALDNAGRVSSSGNAAVAIATPGAQITNSGMIEGNIHGIVTGPSQLPGDAEAVHRAVGTDIVNSGTILGMNNDALRLIGGGTVVNSGTIQGVNASPGGTDGVSMFAFDGQDLAGYETSVINTEDGHILGDRAGVAHSSGGTIDNAGEIVGTFVGAMIQNGAGEDGVDGKVTNSGTIRSTAGEGVVGFGRIDTFTVTNSGTIAGGGTDGVYANTYETGAIAIDNAEGGDITGAQSGVQVDAGQLVLTNAGGIRGEGRGDGVSLPPDGGVAVSGHSANITNSGDISGAQFGIVTYPVYDPETDTLTGIVADTTIVNTGTVIGENDDGIRLAGGGTITNSGTVQGLAQNAFGGTDGVSIFAHNDQNLETYSGALINEEGGVISGIRSGAALSAGGSVTNAGTITGEGQGVFIQGDALDGADREGQVGTLVNSGTISGTGDLGGTYQGGMGVSFASNLATATLTNSGTITSAFAEGVSQGSLGDLTITNEEDGVIEGGTSGIYGGAEGTMTIVNAGTIRGNGAYDGFDAVPDAGITIATRESSVTNTGLISGAGAGITTAYLFDADINELLGLAVGTQVTNSGTILGESNDGVRLIGGGTVANSGTISGGGADLADGVSMFAFEGQSSQDYSALVTNAEGGEISGARFGMILSGGGTIENAGTITGEAAGGALVQISGIEGETGVSGVIANSGTIAGTNGYGAVVLVTDTGALTNSGTIAGASFGALIEAVDSPTEAARVGTLTNSGTITGAGDYGVAVAGFFDETKVENSGSIVGAGHGAILGSFGSATLINTGTISGGELGVLGDGSGPVVLDNAGTITGGSGTAVQFGAFDDSVTLRTGSAISGLVDAGEGTDSLMLDGDVLELTEEQQLGASAGFESLEVASGYWTTSGMVGDFGTVTIGEAGSLQVNEVDLGEEFSSPILTSAVTTHGLLVLNFSEDDLVSELDTLTIGGTGGLQLIGQAVFTVDTDTLTYTGGTTVSNGGLVLTGTLQGDVTTAGEGYFQLGAGGTEGNFAGDIVNDGRFVFNRSDDYDFLGAFSGSGVLDKHGEGTLTFLGDYAFVGVTNILGGAVRIGGIIDPETDFNLGDGGTLDISGNDQTVGGLQGEQETTVELGEQTLTVSQQEDTQFAGAIGGLGGIVKQGDGILNLSGTNTYTGPTNVNGGTLAVNGSIVSSVTVNAGGKLGGNGSVGDTTVGENGTIAPGNSIGRLTVAGDLDFAAGSIYEVEVNAAGDGDRVDATDEVTIDSTATVLVLAEDGDYAPRTDYIILTGEGGVSGNFDSVTTDLAFLDPLLRYGANAVTLSLYRNDVEFADIAVNANQAGVAGAVQALGADNALFEAVLMQNAATAQASFGDLSGEILASTIAGLTDDSRHLRNALMGMAAPAEAGMFIWGSAFGGWGDFDGSASNFGMETDHEGLVAGIGFGGQGFAAAVSGGIGGSDFDLDRRSDAAKVESKFLALHATAGAAGGFHGSAGISYAWHDVETSRAVTGAPLGQTLTSDRDATTLQVFGELGYDLMAGTTAITPFARLAHVSTESDAFTETGGSAALVVAKADQDATFLSLGAKARFNAGEPGFQPYLSAAWNHAFGDRSARIDSRFAADGPVFSVVGTAIPKNSAEIEAGFEYASGAFSIGGAYSGTLASDRTSHGARVTARITF